MNYEEEAKALIKKHSEAFKKILKEIPHAGYDGERATKLKEDDELFKKELKQLKRKYGITEDSNGEG
ncbi:MAG: hypothetical protein IJ168_09070 [Eubacterium sp.]|nr:hypothetical protein [Eubacterium sp.]